MVVTQQTENEQLRAQWQEANALVEHLRRQLADVTAQRDLLIAMCPAEKENTRLRAHLAALQTDDALHRKYRCENEAELEQLRAHLAEGAALVARSIAITQWAQRAHAALQSIAANTCCAVCQEARLVATQALTNLSDAPSEGEP